MRKYKRKSLAAASNCELDMDRSRASAIAEEMIKQLQAALGFQKFRQGGK